MIFLLMVMFVVCWFTVIMNGKSYAAEESARLEYVLTHLDEVSAIKQLSSFEDRSTYIDAKLKIEGLK